MQQLRKHLTLLGKFVKNRHGRHLMLRSVGGRHRRRLCDRSQRTRRVSFLNFDIERHGWQELRNQCLVRSRLLLGIFVVLSRIIVSQIDFDRWQQNQLLRFVVRTGLVVGRELPVLTPRVVGDGLAVGGCIGLGRVRTDCQRQQRWPMCIRQWENRQLSVALRRRCFLRPNNMDSPSLGDFSILQQAEPTERSTRTQSANSDSTFAGTRNQQNRYRPINTDDRRPT